MYAVLLICAVVALLFVGAALLVRTDRAFRPARPPAPEPHDVAAPAAAAEEPQPLVGDARAAPRDELARPLSSEPLVLDAAEIPARGAAPALLESPRPSLIILGTPRATRHPILLAHGYFGFDRIGVGQLRQEYFRGVRARLEALGYSVIVTRVAPVGSIGLRAAQLARQIASLRVPRVNIIAHSMGGLDARLAIARFGLAERVASLTTIGTPHHGTPLAERVLT